jgi:hypothetical protein
MKRFHILLTFIVLLMVVAPAKANIITVDFSGFGNSFIDLTIQNPNNPPGFTGIATPDGLTFAYDDSDNDGMDFAAISSSGIFGTTPHILSMDFGPTQYGMATGLWIDFALIGALEDFVPAGLFVQLDNGELALADAVGFPGAASGNLSYEGSPFSRAFLAFSPDAQYFDISNVSYEPVPEPSTMILLGSGLAGFIFCRRKKQTA